MEDEFLTPDEIYEILCEDCNSTGFHQVLLSCYRQRHNLEVFRATRDRTRIEIKRRIKDIEIDFHYDFNPQTGELELECDVLGELIKNFRKSKYK